MQSEPRGPVRVVVVIPAFNEAERLPRVLAGLAEVDLGGAEVCVVDDGSKDGTAGAARAAGATVLRHPFNLGYGAALQTGYKYALGRGAELVLQMDADGQHDPALLPALAKPIEDGQADLVVGSRFLSATRYRMGPLRSFGRFVFRGLARLVGLSTTDRRPASRRWVAACSSSTAWTSSRRTIPTSTSSSWSTVRGCACTSCRWPCAPASAPRRCTVG